MTRENDHELLDRIVAHFNMKKKGQGWWGCCPAHDDRSPSFSAWLDKDHHLRVNCLAGCRRDDVVAALQGLGLWFGEKDEKAATRAAPQHQDKGPDAAQRRSFDYAVKVWREGQPLAFTLSEVYLRHRGIFLKTWPAALRHHPETSFSVEGGPSLKLPTLLCRLDDIKTNDFRGVIRIALAPDGKGKCKDPRLGTSIKRVNGILSGAVLKLTGDEDVLEGLAIAEGPETALALMAANVRPIWATAGTTNMKAFPVLAGVESLTICADVEPSGAGVRAAEACAARWRAAGREVRVVIPRGDTDKRDFNDLIEVDS
jgi:hypothetical protein